MRTLALTAALLLAGCSAPGAGPDDETTTPSTTLSYFHSAMTLADAPEDNTSAVRTGAFFQAWAAGTDYPTWVSDPFPTDVLVTEANVKLYLRATGPVVESGRFPDIMVYGGSGDAWMGFGDRRDINAFQPDRTYELDVELALPAGGLWLPTGEGFGLKVVPVMLQQDERADVEILVGGDDGSRVTWTTTPITLPASRQSRGEATGEVVGTIYAGPAAPATTHSRVPVAIPAGAAYIAAWMNTTTNVGIPDIDLSIETLDGESLATSGTPTPREGLRLADVNLRGPGDYHLVVTTAGSPRAEYKLEWIVGLAE